MTESLDEVSKRNFVLQQGFNTPSVERCPLQYSALLFQPRVIAVVLLIAIATQSPAIILALGAVLWWSALLPSLNPFDAVYNATFAHRPGRVRVAPAPPPRRFAQTLAGALSVVIAVCLVLGENGIADAVEAFFATAVIVLAFGRFCFGSFGSTCSAGDSGSHWGLLTAGGRARRGRRVDELEPCPREVFYEWGFRAEGGAYGPADPRHLPLPR